MRLHGPCRALSVLTQCHKFSKACPQAVSHRRSWADAKNLLLPRSAAKRRHRFSPGGKRRGRPPPQREPTRADDAGSRPALATRTPSGGRRPRTSARPAQHPPSNL
ncbi:unnamed protein product, partial [Phaeothamnion confervicola]